MEKLIFLTGERSFTYTHSMDTSLSSTDLRLVDLKRSQKLRAYLLRTKRFPSYAELTKIFDVASKNAVKKILERLESAELVAYDASARSWDALPRLTGIAMRGMIGASWPSPAEEELTDAITLDDYLIENKQASFLLRVSGDSMIDAGIHPDDMVIVQRGRTPKNGDIVIAQVDHAWTMKRYQKRGRTVVLVAENINYPVITPSEEIKIDGVVTGVVRKYY
jgi:SOS regulatory protein LexA